MRKPGRSRKIGRPLSPPDVFAVGKASDQALFKDLFVKLLSAGQQEDMPYYYSTPREEGGISIARYARISVSRSFAKTLSTNSYMLLISDDSLAPELRRGAIAFVDPDIA